MTVMPTGALGVTGGVSGVGGERMTAAATGAFKATSAASGMHDSRGVALVVSDRTVDISERNQMHESRDEGVLHLAAGGVKTQYPHTSCITAV